MVSGGLRGVICSALHSGEAAGVSNILQRGTRAVNDFMSWPSVAAQSREFYTARLYVTAEECRKAPSRLPHRPFSLKTHRKLRWRGAFFTAAKMFVDQIGSFPKLLTVRVFPQKGDLELVASRGWITSSMSNQTSWRGCTAAQEPKQATGRVPELEGASQRSLMALVYGNNIIKSHKIPKWQQTRQHKQCNSPPPGQKRKKVARAEHFHKFTKSDLCTTKKSDVIPGPIWSFQTRTQCNLGTKRGLLIIWPDLKQFSVTADYYIKN